MLNLPLSLYLIAMFLFVFLVCSTKKEPGGDKITLLELVLAYSGVTYVYRMFIPLDRKKKLPIGFVWLIGIYFAAYAFTAQRYESQLDKIEFRYSTFTTQVGAGATFSNKRLMGILKEKIPVKKPFIYDPKSVYESFVYNPKSDGPYSQFFRTYSDNREKPFTSAVVFRQEIIKQWAQKLKGANFNRAKLQRTLFHLAKLQGAFFMEAKLQEASFMGAKLQGANFSSAELQGVDFSDAELQGVNFHWVKNLTAKQLIQAKNIEGVKNLPNGVMKSFRKYDYEEMLTTDSNNWSKNLKKRRQALRDQWDKEFFEKQKQEKAQ